MGQETLHKGEKRDIIRKKKKKDRKRREKKEENIEGKTGASL